MGRTEQMTLDRLGHAAVRFVIGSLFAASVVIALPLVLRPEYYSIVLSILALMFGCCAVAARRAVDSPTVRFILINWICGVVFGVLAAYVWSGVSIDDHSGRNDAVVFATKQNLASRRQRLTAPLGGLIVTAIGILIRRAVTGRWSVKTQGDRKRLP